MHKMVTITADIMFVNKILFLFTFSRNIKFRTAEVVPKRTAKSLSQHPEKILIVYARSGFIVNFILGNREFDAVKEHVSLFSS
jgi:hypothetical protein